MRLSLTPEDQIIEILTSEKIDTIATLPCEKMRNLFALVSESSFFRHIPLNKEEEGIGICAGTYLAGGKPLMLIQSSGIGNSINAMMSLTKTYQLPLPILASWRGVYKEKIPAQIPLGKSLPKVLEALDVSYKIVHDASEINLIENAVHKAYQSTSICMLLIVPRTFEGHVDTKSKRFPKRERATVLEYRRHVAKPSMERHKAIGIIAESLKDEAVVSNIGAPSKELYAAGHRDLNFYMLGSLGQASAIGLGVASKTKRETFVLDGDGSLLANTAILSTIAAQNPKNLSIFCLDNGTWGTTGDQLTNAYSIVDLELVAKSMGIKNTNKIQTEKELKTLLEGIFEKDGPIFVHVIVKPGNANVKDIPLSPVQIKQRFMKALKQ